MNPALHKETAVAIAYDAERLDIPDINYFDVEYWRGQNALTGAAVGRGNSWFVNAPFGSVVLRQYLRGGWIARVSRAHYFFTGIERSRPLREFNILVSLFELGLPVPVPIAALCRHHGILSTGALITEKIEQTRTLADVLPSGASGPSMSKESWAKIGNCIRRFHQAGVWHADLNARNVLLDSAGQVYLIDFDRARFTAGKKVHGQGNLSRLKRSLRKLWPGTHAEALQPAWEHLMAGYDG